MEGSAPKYQVLADWLRRQIVEGQLGYGERCYSENRLCEMFGYSRQTVRQAIALLEDERYIARRQGSGTYVVWRAHGPAAAVRTVGVITTYVDNYIFPAIIRGIEQVLSAAGYSMHLMLTYNQLDSETRALSSVLKSKVDGLIVEPAKSALPSPNLPLFQAVRDAGIPVVMFNTKLPELDWPYVSLDDRAVGRMATSHLIGLGHKAVAGIFLGDDHQGRLRYAGYLDALGKAGLPINSGRVLWYTTSEADQLFRQGGRLQRCLDGCTAAFCYNDQIAADLMDWLAKSGVRVPEQLSVIGVDNFALADYCDPPLTSVNHPKEQLGKMAARNLLRLMEDPGFDPGYLFAPKLVERASVRPLAL